MITGVVLARNEARHIAACLASLRPHVGELFLIDMESSDETVALAKPYVDKIIPAKKTPNFDAARNLAIPEARFEWLWYLDADERVSQATAQHVQELIQKHGHELAAIWIPFKTHFCQKWIEHCGWWPGYTMPRVLKRGRFKFSERLHGGVDVQGQHYYLPPDPNLGIEHYSYDSIEHYLEKFNRYTSTEAQQFKQAGEALDWETGLREMVRDWQHYYEDGQAAQDGIHGWILSWLGGQYRWFARAKLLDSASPEAIAQVAVPATLDAALEVMQDELAKRRVANPQLPLGVVFHSPLWDPSGYAEDGRTLLRALAAGNRQVAAKSIPWSHDVCPMPVMEQSLYRALENAKRPSHSIAITNCIATLVGPDSGAAYNILRTTQETDRIPADWLPRLAAFDEIWVLSQHNARAFRQSGVAPEKLRIVNPACDTDIFRPEGKIRPRPVGLEDRLIFLSILDWQLRKGWDALVKGFVETFKLEDGAALLFKITRQHGHSIDLVKTQINDVLAEIGTSLDERSDIVLLEEFCDSRALASLYRSCDAFVLASRGEGWGRPYMEAMACGLPTIGTRGSGNDDFMHEGNSYLVDVEQVPVNEEAIREISVFAGHYWNEPDLGSLKFQMRRVFELREHSREIGRVAAGEIAKSFSLEALERSVTAMLDEVENCMVPSMLEQPSTETLSIELEGEFFAGHSFSNINESLALGWAEDAQIALSCTRRVMQPPQDRITPAAGKLKPYLHRPFSGEPNILIRHAFPPNWNPPAGANTKWVHIQPWEFGALPVDWIAPLKYQVDEIWAPSEYVKQVYVRSGIPAEKIITIPWGIDEQVYHPQAPPLHLPTTKSLKLLFVGGAIPRKGFDILLEAYRQEFSRDEDICLVVKDLGTQSFYRYGHCRDALQAALEDPQSPEIVYLDADFSNGLRASLYTACDVLVAPYRGEGFGLPVLEAMACGLVPVVPRGGATDDFTRQEFTEYLTAQLVATHHDWRLVGQATELSIDVAHLRQVLRRLYDNRAQIPERGQLAANFAQENYSWRKNILPVMTDRLRRLRDEPSPPIRSRPMPVFLGARAVVPHPLPITACFVTHDNEDQLADSLARIAPFVQEIVIADLQSQDASIAIAHEYRARVFSVSWEESFSSAPNIALQQAGADWILSLDLGEYFADADWKRLAALLENLPPRIQGVLFDEPTLEPIPASEIRLFRNDSRLRLEYRGAPSIRPSIRRSEGGVVHINLRIQRDMRVRWSAEAIATQTRLLQLDLCERGGDPHLLIALGQLRFKGGDYFHAECYLRDALNGLTRLDERYESLVRALIECYQFMDDPYRAAEMKELLGGTQQNQLTEAFA